MAHWPAEYVNCGYAIGVHGLAPGLGALVLDIRVQQDTRSTGASYWPALIDKL